MGEIHLRPLTVGDAAISYKWRNDAGLWKYTGSRPTVAVTPEIERDWAARVIADSTRANYAICTSDESYIGNIYLIHMRDGIGELGIFIGERNCHGKGYGTQALLELKRIAQKNLGLRAILINVDEKNQPALRTYEKCGAIRFSGHECRPLPKGRFWMRIEL